MSDLRELLRANAPDAGEPDLNAVRARTPVLARRRRMARTGAAALLAVTASIGAVTVTNATEDSSSVIADAPDVPNEGRGRGGPEVDAEAEADAEPGSGRAGAIAEVEDPTAGGIAAGGSAAAETEEGSSPSEGEPGAASPDEPGRTDSPPAPGTAGRSGGTIAFTDPTGDVQADPRVSSAGRDTEGEPQLDVISGKLDSDGRSLHVETRVVDLEEVAPSGASGSAYRFSFDYEAAGTRYRVLVAIERYNDSQFIRLDVSGDGKLTQDPCDGCTATFDADGETVSGTIPLDVLDQALGDIGGGDSSGRASDPFVETLWIDSPNRAQDCEQPGTLGSVCSSQGAVADTADGRGAFDVR